MIFLSSSISSCQKRLFYLLTTCSVGMVSPPPRSSVHAQNSYKSADSLKELGNASEGEREP